MAITLSNPHKPHTWRWWIHEGGICTEDEHPQAARAAYAQALQLAETDDERWLAAWLLERA